MNTKKPNIGDNKIRDILASLSQRKKWDDIEYELDVSRNTIGAVKSWFNLLSWGEAKVFSRGDDQVLSARGDYLGKKAIDEHPKLLLSSDLEKHQQRYFRFLASIADRCFIPPLAFFYDADWESGKLEFFTGDCALCGGQCVFEKIAKAIEEGDKEKLKSITRPKACTAKTVTLTWTYQPRAKLLLESPGCEDLKEHILGTELCDTLSEIKKLGIYYIMSAPVVLAHLEDEAQRERPRLQLKPKRFEAARTDDETAKFLSETVYELWFRLIELNNKAVHLIRQWLLDPLTMPKTECPVCAPFGGLGYR
jgi:hypothetical protein